MPVPVTEAFMRDFDPARYSHTYIDQELCIRDFFIEDMFTTLFDGKPLTDGFKTNFRTYMSALFGSDDNDVPDTLFEDHGFAKQYVRVLFGLAHIRRYAHDDEPVFDHCTHTGILRTQYSDGGELVVHAPSELNAALLLIVSVMRWRAEQTFIQMMASEQDVSHDDTTETNESGY